MRRVALLAVALLVAGCGDSSEEPAAPAQRADAAERGGVGDAAVAFYTSRDPRVCRTNAARTLIEKTLTAGGAARVREAIRSCERNRRVNLEGTPAVG